MKASNQTEESPKVRSIIKVAIVEDHTLLRESLTQALNEEDEVQVVFDASNGREFFEHLKKKKIDKIYLGLVLATFAFFFLVSAWFTGSVLLLKT